MPKSSELARQTQSLAELIRQAKERRDSLKREIAALKAERAGIESQPRTYKESVQFFLQWVESQQALAFQNNPLLAAMVRNPGNASPADVLADPILGEDPMLTLALLATPESIAARFEPVIAASCEQDPGIDAQARSDALARIDADIAERQAEVAEIDGGLAAAQLPPPPQPKVPVQVIPAYRRPVEYSPAPAVESYHG